MNDAATTGFHTVNKAVQSAQQLGALGPAAIYALFCLLLIVFIIWREKQRMNAEREWLNIRTSEAVTDAATAAGISRLADVVQDMKSEMTVLTTIVDERLKRS